MFAVWACKQVMDIASTNLNRRMYQHDHDPKCPSCGVCDETCGHILRCEEAGRVDSLQRSITNLDTWLDDMGTDPTLRRLLVEYARGRGGRSLFDLTPDSDSRFDRWATSQDIIGWRRFMEGMISKELISIQRQYYATQGGRLTPEAWARSLVVRLLEVTHGQWIYRNIQVHDSMTGTLATQRKEQIQKLIEDQIELGGEGLAEEDKWLLEINLEDLETTSGETQQYWLLAIMAARAALALRAQQNNDSEVSTD